MVIHEISAGSLLCPRYISLITKERAKRPVFRTLTREVGLTIEFWNRVVYPKKYPYPIPENFGSITGIYPISIPVKVSSPTPSSYPIPERNTQHVGYEIWFDLGVFLRLFDPNSAHTHTRHPIKLARVRVFTRHQYPTKFPIGYFKKPDIQLKVPLRVYPYPYPYSTGFFVGYTTLLETPTMRANAVVNFILMSMWLECRLRYELIDYL